MPHTNRLGPAQDHRLPPAATYDAGGAVGDLHDTINRRLAEAGRVAAHERTRTERLYRAISVSTGYAALALGSVALVAAALLR